MVVNELELKQEVSAYLADVKINEVMSTNVLTARTGWSVRQLSQFFFDKHISGAPVVTPDDRLIGVVTQSDIVRFETHKPTRDQVLRVLEESCGAFNHIDSEDEIQRIKDTAIDHISIEMIMTRNVISVDVETSLEEAIKILQEQDIHRLFVTDSGQLVGVLSAMDVLKTII